MNQFFRKHKHWAEIEVCSAFVAVSLLQQAWMHPLHAASFSEVSAVYRPKERKRRKKPKRRIDMEGVMLFHVLWCLI